MSLAALEHGSGVTYDKTDRFCLDHLPALHHRRTNVWTSGFSAIADALQEHVSATATTTGSAQPPLTRVADEAAYSAFLTAHAAPLLALSLYVSSANWAGAVRPAYSRILPFPLPWIEPAAVRAAMALRADHLGLSSLDADATEAREAAARERSAAAGWVNIPAGLRAAAVGLRDSMTPEQASSIRLRAVAGDVLDVLEDARGRGLLGSGAGEEGEDEEGAAAAAATPLACLAYGYLALMLLPELPRPWLRDFMRAEHGGLCALVESFGRRIQARLSALPRQDDSGCTALNLGSRFISGALGSIPGAGDVVHRWTASSESAGQSHLAKTSTIPMAKSILTIAAVFASLTASVFIWRSYPLGSPLYRFEAPKTGFRSLGAAGAILAGAGVLNNGWGGFD